MFVDVVLVLDCGEKCVVSCFSEVKLAFAYSSKFTGWRAKAAVACWRWVGH
jgi:hypothetical protein